MVKREARRLPLDRAKSDALLLEARLLIACAREVVAQALEASQRARERVHDNRNVRAAVRWRHIVAGRPS